MSELANIFNEADEKEMGLVNLLDDAYLAVRYENNYQIESGQLEYLVDKAQSLYEIVRESCQMLLEPFERKPNSFSLSELN